MSQAVCLISNNYNIIRWSHRLSGGNNTAIVAHYNKVTHNLSTYKKHSLICAVQDVFFRVEVSESCTAKKKVGVYITK